MLSLEHPKNPCDASPLMVLDPRTQQFRKVSKDLEGSVLQIRSKVCYIRAMEDKELKAISSILSSLEGLDSQEKERVFKYVMERLGVSSPSHGKTILPLNNPHKEIVDQGDAPAVIHPPGITVNDIRSLKEEKKPESAIQMAALVAFYLQEIATGDEKRDSIDVNDVKKYFNQAGFPLPKIPKSALINTKAAGYFESADRGRYKLNPVGYNLVAYGLPAKSGTINAKRPKTQTKKKGKK